MNGLFSWAGVKTAYRTYIFFLILLIGISAKPQSNPALSGIHLDSVTYPLYDQSYALLIGVSNYSNGWPELPGVKSDLKEVKSALEVQGFRVFVVDDPDRDQMDDAITNFIQQYGQQPYTRLLIYYAGHGYTARSSYGENIGYLIPVDAPRPYPDFGGFQSKAIEMSQFDIYSKRIQSKHALFIFDACFSGSLFLTSKALIGPLTTSALKPVRQFITSGSADEQVPDKSIFCRQFVESFRGAADFDGDGYITGTELGDFLQKTVSNYSRRTQNPQYGKLRNPNLDKGEFIFLSATRLGSSGFPPAELTPDKSPETDLNTQTFIPPADQQVTRQSVTTGTTGELMIFTKLTGDLYIGEVFHRTIIENTTVMLFNVPSGKQVITLKGDSPWRGEVEVKTGGVTEVKIPGP